MAGSGPLTPSEERQFLRLARELPAIRRALVMTHMFTGFRVSETLSLRVRQVVDRQGEIVQRIGVSPRRLDQLVIAGDWTRKPKAKAAAEKRPAFAWSQPPRPPSPPAITPAVGAAIESVPSGILPGFESFFGSGK